MTAGDNVETMVLAEQLHKAITENREKEDTIKRVLGSNTFEERQKVVQAYKDTYRQTVRESFAGAFVGSYNRFVFRLCLSRYENAAYWIKDAAKGWFCTDERALLGLLITYSSAELDKVVDAYKQLFDRASPKDAIETATSSDLRTLLIALIGKKDGERASSDAEGEAIILYKATEGRIGTKESEVCSALTSGNREFLKQVLEQYLMQGCEEDLEICINKETSGWFRTGLLMLITWIRDPAKFYAGEIHHALNGWFFVNHCALRNYIIDRSEIDIKQISMAYEELFGRTLVEAIESKIKGAYRDLIISVINVKSQT